MGGKDEWGTPPDLFAILDREFHFDLDVAATEDNALCETYFTGPCEPNYGRCMCGLCRPWAGRRAYMNPPYSEPSTWCQKAAREAQTGKVLVVALLPASVGEHWFHQFVFNVAHEIRVLRGRLAYVPAEGYKESSNRFGSVVAIYRPGPPPLRGANVIPWDWRRHDG